jgi:RimJ/RimL family protein N-acetyltransferase
MGCNLRHWRANAVKVVFRAFHGPTDWAWIRLHIGALQVEDTSGIIAVSADTGEIVGACVMDNWTFNSVQAHFAITSPMVLRHGFLQECVNYVFNVADKQAIYGFIPASNKKAIKLNTHMGFTEVFRIPEGFGKGVDYVAMQMLKENCKVLPETA